MATATKKKNRAELRVAALNGKTVAKKPAVKIHANIDLKHKKWDANYPHVQKVRDFIMGGASVLPYIIKLEGHGTTEYEEFQRRAYFLPAVARTLEAFTGMIMNPEPVITVPEEMKEYLKDISNDGEPIDRMIAATVSEVASVSRCAVLVDFPRVEETGEEMSVAEAEELGLRAYAKLYKFEDIIDWRTESFGGQRYLAMVKLCETHIEKVDEWTQKEVPQIRVLDFGPNKSVEGGEAYRVRIFRRQEGGWEQIGTDFFPEADGELLDEIPLVIFGPKSLDPTDVLKPLLLDMVDISEKHYNNSALLEWSLKWLGSPTAVFKGLKSVGNEPIRLGSSQGIVTTADGGAEILSLPADGVGAIDKQMERKRADMAAVGARLLQDETKTQIARDTAIIQRAGEHSVLATMAQTVADGWERVLRIIAIWAGVQIDEDEEAEDGSQISVKLNTDYIPLGLQVGELADLMKAVNEGKLSSRDLFALLQKRGTIRADKTFDEHLDEIEEDDTRIADNPRVGAVPPPPPGGGGEVDDDGNPIDPPEDGDVVPPNAPPPKGKKKATPPKAPKAAAK